MSEGPKVPSMRRGFVPTIEPAPGIPFNDQVDALAGYDPGTPDEIVDEQRVLGRFDYAGDDLTDAAEIAALRRHEDAIEQVIARHQVKVGDPGFEQLASARRSAIYAQRLSMTCVGDDAGFIEPPTEHTPDPKPATGFAVTQVKRRAPRRQRT
jgi:hypothetical protein